MSTTIEAPATYGQKVELTDDVVGSFLVHRSTHPTFIGDEVKHLWCVTHVATGMRFPWQFNFKSAARGFAKDVEAVIDWSAVKVEMSADPYAIKGQWIEGKPTEAQNAAVYEAARARGAINS